MTREKAKCVIESMLFDAEKYGDIDYDNLNDFISASKVAIESLSDVPDINVGDTISRQAAIDALDVLCQEHRYKIPGKRETYSPYNEAWQDALDRAEGAIGNLPSAEQTGQWEEKEIHKGYIEEWQSAKCSNCGLYHTVPYMYYFKHYEFCPHCGAKMEV